MSSFWRMLIGGLVVCAVVLLTVAANQGAMAQADKGLVIAIIDMQKILRDSIAVKKMQKTLEQRRSGYQNELRQKEQQLRNSNQELVRQQAILSAEAFAKKRQELEQQVAAVQRDVQEKRRGLDALLGQGMKQIRIVLVEIVQGIAINRDADLVLAKSIVVLVRPDLEITDEALALLNKKLPEVTLPVPQN